MVGNKKEEDEQDWEFEGSGLWGSRRPPVEELIDQLYVRLSSIKAGNTLSKLWKAVVSLVAKLVQHCAINEFQRCKVVRDYIR